MTKAKPDKPPEVARFRAKLKACPICKRPGIVEHRPFCSQRCAQVDLGRWLGEVYRVSGDEDESSEAETWSASTSPRRDGE